MAITTKDELAKLVAERTGLQAGQCLRRARAWGVEGAAGRRLGHRYRAGAATPGQHQHGQRPGQKGVAHGRELWRRHRLSIGNPVAAAKP